MKTWEALCGPNVGYALELYERYQQDPSSVDEATQQYFHRLEAQGNGAGIAAKLGGSAPNVQANGHNGAATDGPFYGTAFLETPLKPASVSKVVMAARLARSIRSYGHLDAKIDPLGAPRPGDPMLDGATHGISDEDLRQLPATIVWSDAGHEAGTCLDAIRRLRDMYSGTMGYEFDHLQNFSERAWLHEAVENDTFRQPLPPDTRRALLHRLSQVEGLETFLHTKFLGQKRFSIEGTDTLVPILDTLLEGAGASNTHEVLIGMAHRGRLNVLAHVLDKPYTAIFSEFHNPNTPSSPEGETSDLESGWSGDVKYHLGAHRMFHEADARDVRITLADNPSHLEVVAPVVEGFARAAQENREHAGPPIHDPCLALPITIHGDAAFPGEGVVAETLNLSHLPGYTTGGTLRIIVNNQVGFTTGSDDGRSTLYASDLAKGYDIPIVHVNADDPEACVSAARLAFAYRQRFNKDVLIDLVGYRRWGHNEGDEPSFTQPRMYAEVTGHPTVRSLYASKLQAEGVLDEADAALMQKQVRDELDAALEHGDGPANYDLMPLNEQTDQRHETAVDEATLRELNEALLRFPHDFHLHPKLQRILMRREDALTKENAIDWGHAEALAFASILADGTPIRLTGQDTERGTFSQRHLVLHDPESGGLFTALQALPQARASFAVYNSPLTETATLGFEYGYGVHAPSVLVLWEAQYGDFVNVGQAVLDQFITTARAKWRQQPALTLLLPHGYEGQGPEHSSARIERFLQLAAEDNIRVANCTTSAQYFHLLRSQAASLGGDRRPLVVMTPKSLLRHALSASSLCDLSDGSFQPVLDDRGAVDRKDRVERLVLCSGKIAIDLTTTAKQREEPVDWVAVARLEQLYPFPANDVRCVVAGYPNLREVMWLQEEPENMGAWTYVSPKLRCVLGTRLPLHYIGRPERASPAEGIADAHMRDQTRIVDAAFSGERSAVIETHGVHDAS